MSKEQYYKRRWFLAILFLGLGLWLLYLGYSMLGYNKEKDELFSSTDTPCGIEIKYDKTGKYRNIHLVHCNTTNSISSVLDKNEHDKLWYVIEKKIKQIGNKNSFSLEHNELKVLDYQYLFWKDKLYELKIDNETIIAYEMGSNKIAHTVLTVGLLWTGFQVWIIYTLLTKGRKVYDESFTND
ncbi:MAG: hypothetical protein AAFZ89_01455 [Bacteroidota bacterium]